MHLGQILHGNAKTTHVTDFIAAYNYARRLKTQQGLTPFEYICKIWKNKPGRFI